MTGYLHGSQGGQLLEHVVQCLERHMLVHGGSLWFDYGTSYSHARGDNYINPIQHWIKQAWISSGQWAVGTHQPRCDFDVYFHLQELTLVFSYTVIEILSLLMPDVWHNLVLA